MSIAQLMRIIRNHTGSNSNDSVKITHQEVLDMIHAAEDHGHVSIAARCLLLETLAMFGGNDIHPDIFSSREDKAAIVTTSMRDIETAKKFAGLPARSQLKFIKNALGSDLGELVGFSTSRVQVNDLPATIQDRINLFLQSEKVRAGGRYDEDGSVGVTAFVRNGEQYGYQCSAYWPTKSGDGGGWVADFYVDQDGDALDYHSRYEPPDPDVG
jgi:hypothetical protein